MKKTQKILRKDNFEATQIAKNLVIYNEKRQDIEKKVFDMSVDDEFPNGVEFLVTVCELSDEDFNKLRKCKIYEKYEDWEVCRLIKNSDPELVSNVVDIIVNSDAYNMKTVEELSKLSSEQRKQAELIIANTKASSTADVAKCIPYAQFLPDNFFEKIDNYDINQALGDSISYSVTDDYGVTQTFYYDKEQGLYEVKVFDVKTNKAIVHNLRTSTAEEVEYRDEDSTIKKQVSKKYDSLAYDEKTGKVSYGNIVNTQTISQSGVENFYNITTLDADGNSILPTQYCTKNENGEFCVSKEFVSPSGVKTSYYYEETQDNIQIINYTITDSDGKVLMNKRQTMQVVNDNKIITSVNDHVYEAEFNNDTLIITDKATGKQKELHLDFLKEGKEVMYELLKTVPANLLMAIDELPIKEMSFDADGDDTDTKNNGHFNATQRALRLGYSDFLDKSDKKTKTLSEFYTKIFIHEFGHYLDTFTDEANDNIGSISVTDEIKGLFEKELNALLKSSTTQEQSILTHMIDNQLHNKPEECNYHECLAESISALYGNPAPSDIFSFVNSRTGIRESFLMKDFPVLIAKIHEIIESKYNSAEKDNQFGI